MHLLLDQGSRGEKGSYQPHPLGLPGPLLVWVNRRGLVPLKNLDLCFSESGNSACNNPTWDEHTLRFDAPYFCKLWKNAGAESALSRRQLYPAFLSLTCLSVVFEFDPVGWAHVKVAAPYFVSLERMPGQRARCPGGSFPWLFFLWYDGMYIKAEISFLEVRFSGSFLFIQYWDT